MRVLMVSSLWPPAVLGGAEQYAAALSGQLRRAGHSVGVVTFGVPGEDVVATVAPRPYPLQTFAAQSAPRRARFHLADALRTDARRVIATACERFRPDVVHSHVVQGMGTTALTEPGVLGVPHVHTLHDYWLLCQRNSMTRRDGSPCGEQCRSCRAVSSIRDRRIDRHPPDVVIAVSEAVARPHLARLAWMRGRTRVVYNPVGAPTAPRPVRDRSAPATFGFLGRLGADKGILTLLDAFGTLVQTGAGAEVRLVVAGRGPEAAAVEATPGVEFRGWVADDEKEALLAELDCLVVPSEWPDPAPLVVNEARRRGITVIGSTAGGIPELVAPVDEGLLVPPGDAVALASAMARVVAAPGTYAPEPAAEPLDEAGHLEAIVTAYEDAIAPG
jgi:glycogen synthase